MKKFTSFILLLLTVTVINYPNPFNPHSGGITTFESTADQSLEAVVYIYDMSARLCWQKNFSLGGGTTSRTTWDGYTNANELASNGVYLYRVVDQSTRKSLAKGKIWIVNQ